MVLRVGHWVVVYDRPHCSIGREFTVISPELLCPAGWGCLRRACPTGMPGDPRRSVGTASNLHDALAIHRGAHQTIRWRSTAKPDEFVRADPRSRYGRKSGFLPQGDWLVHPVAWLVRLGGAGSTGPPRVRHGGLPSPRIVPRCVAWWAPPPSTARHRRGDRCERPATVA